jgi:ELWxxDGT repeat protein
MHLASVSIQELFSDGTTLYFSGRVEAYQSELWASDGTPEGTRVVKELDPGALSPRYFAATSDAVFFSGNHPDYGVELWRTDGQESGTYQVRDIFPASEGSGVRDMTRLRGELVFGAFSSEFGEELWASDGSYAGTRIVKDIQPGVDGSLGRDGFVNLNSRVFFFADDGLTGVELWSSDGTESGTSLVIDINPGPGDSGHRYAPLNSRKLVRVGDIFYFAADDGVHGDELWRSDGSAAGTFMVSDIYAEGDSGPSQITAVGARVYFTATTEQGRKLWLSDGTEAGTYPVDYRSPRSPSAQNLTEVGGKLFFVSDGCSPTTQSGCTPSGRELFVTDGTAEGTINLDLRPGNASSYPQHLTSSNGRLYFSASNDGQATNLWVSDGTTTGTVQVTTDAPFAPSAITDVNSTLLFSGYDATHGRELWASDGTSVGTWLVKDIFPGSKGSDPINLFEVRGSLVFSAQNGEHGIEPWRSDGTDAGTYMVGDLAPGAFSSTPRDFALVGPPYLFFAAEGGSQLSNEELWKLTIPEGAAPQLGQIIVEPQQVLSGQEVQFEVAFQDAFSTEAHAALWIWGDGSTTEGDLEESGNGGTVFGDHIFDAPCHCVVKVVVTSADGVSGSGSTILDVRFNVIHALESLVADLASVNLANGIQNSLDKKLEAVLRALSDLRENNGISAKNAMAAFVNEIYAQRGDKISIEDADRFISAAEEIIEHMD